MTVSLGSVVLLSLGAVDSLPEDSCGVEVSETVAFVFLAELGSLDLQPVIVMASNRHRARISAMVFLILSPSFLSISTGQCRGGYLLKSIPLRSVQ